MHPPLSTHSNTQPSEPRAIHADFICIPDNPYFYPSPSGMVEDDKFENGKEALRQSTQQAAGRGWERRAVCRTAHAEVPVYSLHHG